ncbi:HAD-IA family hydrolase [Aestuariivirga sp.]|uniref:HAD-IA family hydrolase n=1 Tax=Aestuariivirga sp. TaxID=2650926 RepID=UPI0035937A9A
MPLTDRKVLTFDVVGTLIDFEAGILDYVQAKAKAAGVKLTDQTILEAYAAAEDRQHHEAPRLPFPSMMAPMYREMADVLGLPGTEDDVENFRLSIPNWPAFPDSIAALNRLRKHFYLVAMTNSDNWALSHFAKTLDLPFDDLVTAEMVGWNKPDPQVFAFVRGRLSKEGYGFGDILHVAQSQYHDIAVALRLGYHTCWIERRKGKPGAGATPKVESVAIPDYHFGSLVELADAVNAGK